MAIATRLINTGSLLVKGSFDENTSISPAKFSTTPTTVYAAELDEVTINGGSVAKRELDTGVLQVSNEFDELSLSSGSIDFSGATVKYLLVQSDPDLGLGTGDFTIEGWCYNNFSSVGVNLFDSRTAATSSGLNMNITGNPPVPVYRPAGVNQITGSSLSFNTWYHIAYVRISGVTKMYVNGTQSGISYTDTLNIATTNVRVGATYNGTIGSNGSISNFRMIKGTGIYTQNFTPQRQILPAVSGTSLLFNVTTEGNLIVDNGPRRFTASNINTAVWSASGPFNT